jgi:hypothetical protein
MNALDAIHVHLESLGFEPSEDSGPWRVFDLEIRNGKSLRVEVIEDESAVMLFAFVAPGVLDWQAHFAGMPSRVVIGAINAAISGASR